MNEKSMLRATPVSLLALGLALSQLSACSTVGSIMSGDTIDYRSAKKVPTLEVPPDLTQLAKDNRYNLPDTASAPAVTSYNVLKQSAAANTSPTAANAAVLPTRPDVRIERSGDQRWLVVNLPPEKIYGLVRDFWQNNGFLIRMDMPEAGVMETDWAENRAKIPQGVIRDALSKVLDSVYSTGERDKFRTRIERLGNGESEIYITHRGMIEKLVGTTKDRTMWEARPRDPGLEAEFLQRLMVRFGYDIDRAKAQLAAAPGGAADSSSAGGSAGASPAAEWIGQPGRYTGLTLAEPFDRAWRNVGLALDRASFTVEDRNRAQGIYFVRYVPQDDNQDKPGFFGRLLGRSTDKNASTLQYQVQVEEQGGKSQIQVLPANAGSAKTPETAAAISRIVELIRAQL